MSWADTHERNRIVRAVEARLESGADETPLAWTPEYADVFGDRMAFHAHLAYRWRLRLSTQLEAMRDDAAWEHAAAVGIARAGLMALERERVRSRSTSPGTLTAA
ncbi:hypothetical protein [Nocardioides sp. R-C-SC26]|uniref:hypothetical protein n=1 Tax=Nocardioides sp. R-C-SC26 TaxID=2870414 RepID=UPI001E38617B|nr:hypothetical protein [Nocardioides sp. R-C-SC26]